MQRFEGKIVVVTGAGGGMGRAYARAFARRGARLALNDWDAQALEETVGLVGGDGATEVHAAAFDVGDRDAVYAFAAAVREQFGNAHVIINNAGIEGSARPVWATEDTDFERVMRINFFGVVHGTRAFLPQLLENGEGAIVNISSVFGLMGTPNCADYCASKFAVRGFTEALMVELQESPISVHVVHPGGIATGITRSERSQAFGRKYLTTPPEEIVEVVIEGIRKRRPRIVYGRDSLRLKLAASFVPRAIVNRLAWRELKRVLGDTEDYPADAAVTARA